MSKQSEHCVFAVEEMNLSNCLDSVRGLFDEMVIVDTGSTDRTIEIALSFGAKVFEFAWVDSFSAARNEALSHATGDYAFWLDADDVVMRGEKEKLRTMLGSLKRPGRGADAQRVNGTTMAADALGAGLLAPPSARPEVSTGLASAAHGPHGPLLDTNDSGSGARDPACVRGQETPIQRSAGSGVATVTGFAGESRYGTRLVYKGTISQYRRPAHSACPGLRAGSVDPRTARDPACVRGQETPIQQSAGSGDPRTARAPACVRGQETPIQQSAGSGDPRTARDPACVRGQETPIQQSAGSGDPRTARDPACVRGQESLPLPVLPGNRDMDRALCTKEPYLNTGVATVTGFAGE
jgi:hypothetical protein